MSRRSHPPTKRLLVAPAAILAGVLAVVIGVGGTADTRSAPQAAVAGVPAPLPSADLACERERAEGAPGRPPLITAGRRVTSEVVLACPALFDELTVTYVGELVGDLLHRGGGAWVQVNDDDYALLHGPLPAHRDHAGTNSSLSVWLPDELLDEVTGLGRPGQRGDVVRVDGIIRRTDHEDGGGLTLRAREMQVLRPAEAFEEPFDPWRLLLAGTSLLVAAVLWTLRRRSRQW